ncbi:TonB-dependent receptor [Echinicola sp. CAU 1574]|uniref:TonB-dependent receptor n=1 Tax=Echinicola arenosa TaxID=2774144 RepID=A0ABR9APS1_9BACT|nr:TonB-dependent receptor [Echinicola arenosa]
MKYRSSCLIFLALSFLSLTNGVCQGNYLIKGNVIDAQTKEILLGAAIYWQGAQNSGVTSNTEGEFEIKTAKLPRQLVVSFVGYEKRILSISPSTFDQFWTVSLVPVAQGLEEVVIEGGREASLTESTDLGKNTLPISTLKNIPSLFGEVDVLRSLQLLPGVQTVGEGTTGLFVRGGSSDQNLIQLDGAPVYNPSHFFGFFSVFNPDALESVDLYKGNIPANYGGRLSSVVDIKMKEGRKDRVHGEGGIGNISSKIALDGPLFSEKSTFVVSARRTYVDAFLGLSSNEDINSNTLYFYDLGGKFTFRPSDNDKLSFSSYYGSDYLEVEGLFGFGWKNWISSGDWSRTINDQWYLDVNGYYSQYAYSIDIKDDENGFLWKNILSESGFRPSLTWHPSDVAVFEMGLHSRYYHFSPVKMTVPSESKVEPIKTNSENALQNDLFVSSDIDINPKLKIEGGIRLSLYIRIGKGVQYIYENEPSDREEEIIDTLYFDSFEKMKAYQALEPRLSVRFKLKENTAVKAAYNRNYQYLQMAANNSAGLPIDRWAMASEYIQPVKSDQYSVGLFKTYKENRWELSLETYYKDYKHIIDVKQGADILFTDNIESQVLSGKGWSYGLEMMIKKNLGRTTGWLGYTYSRTYRQVPGISEGEAYNPRYDRPHDVSFVFQREFSERLTGNITFVYSTGQAVSYPVGSYSVDSQEIPVYSSKRNEDRFPDYHRMDASVILKNKDKGKMWRGSWSFSIYNLYGRKNPYSYQFTNIINNDINYSSSSGEPIYSRRPGVVMTYLFTFLPSVSYNFEF